MVISSAMHAAFLNAQRSMKVPGRIPTASATRQRRAAPNHSAAPAAKAASRAVKPTPDEALQMLLDGNARFICGKTAHATHTPKDFSAIVDGQTPFAVVVGCADSRAGPESLFDQTVGDLFVVRIAGNVLQGAGPTIKGSIEFAVAELQVPLVMVLGHSNCGAVTAAIKHIDDQDALPGALNRLVNLIKPVVREVKGMPGDKLDNAIRANVERGVRALKKLEPVVAPAVRARRLRIVGAIYDLGTGRVTLVA